MPDDTLRIARTDEALLVAGAMADNRQHRHHAMQVVWAEGEARLETPEGTYEAPVLIIESGVAHRLQLPSGLVGLIEGESALAASLRHRWLDGDAVATPEPSVQRPLQLEGAAELLGELAGRTAPHVVDLRVKRVLKWLSALERGGGLAEASLDEALRRTKLSESRFLHLFRNEVGTPWRGYLIWRRALYAMSLAVDGGSLTKVAHAAGYADSAHLSRQFRELFGYSPSDARRRSQFVQV